MRDFMYSVWFCDETLLPEDQDYEWVAMFIVEAESEAAALAWGDRIADRYTAVRGELFVRSHVEDPLIYGECLDFEKTPRCVEGDDLNDPLDQ